MNEVKEIFLQLRFDKDHHLGLGDIRITIGQQELIESKFEAIEKQVEKLEERIKKLTSIYPQL